MKKILTFIFLLFFVQNIKSQNLLDAVKDNEYQAVKSLLEKGENPNFLDENNATLLMWAVYSGDLGLVKLLVDFGADFSTKGIIYTSDGESYYGNLTGIAAALDKIEILQFLIENCKINVDDKEFIIETGLEEGWTAIQWASYMGNDEIVKYLIDNKANIDANHTIDGGTPLLLALQNLNITTAKLLIEHGADVNLKWSNGWAAIHFAVNNRMYEITKMLIDNGADVNTKTQDGYNSLVLGAYGYYYSCCQLLMENGADANVKDKNGYSALDYAKMYKYNLIYKLFENSGYEPEINDENLGELINIAVDYYWSERYEETVDLLENILPFIKDYYGENDTTFYGILLSYAAFSYDIIENYSMAEKYYFKTIDIYKELNENSLMLAYTYNYFAEMYVKIDDYQNAEKYYLKTLEIYKKIYGEENSLYSDYLLTIAFFYHNNLNFGKAEEFYLKYKENIEINYGNENEYYTVAIYYLASFYMDFGFYLDAEEYMSEDLQLTEKISGKYNLNYIFSLKNIITLYTETANYGTAIENAIILSDISKTLYTENSEQFANSQIVLAGIYSDLGIYSEAEKYYQIAIQILEDIYIEDITDLAAAINGLAIIYQAQGYYSNAEQLFKKAIDLTTTNVREIDYAACLGNLAELYRVSGNYEKSEEIFFQTLEIQKRILSENSEDYANTLNNLALLYSNMSDYQNSEKCFLQAKEIRKNILGEKHPDYAVTLNNLGLLYQNLGNYEQAIKHYQQSIKIRETTLGLNHPAYAVSLNNLGLLYLYNNYTEDAIVLFTEAIRIQENSFEETNPELATYYDNLAFCYILNNQYDKAEKYAESALEIRKIQLGENHLNYAVSLNNLSKIYANSSKYTKAEKLLLQDISITENNLGKDNIYYAMAISDLALLYIKSEKYEKADELIFEANRIFNEINIQTGKFMSENEREAFVYNKTSYYLDIFCSYAIKRYKQNDDFNILLYNNSLSNKNMILNSNLAMRKQIIYSNNENLKQIYNQYIENNIILADLYSVSIENRSINTDSLENATNIIEKEMITLFLEENNSLSDNFIQLTNNSYSYENIKNALQENEAAIEFISFDNYEDNWTGEVIYAAVVLRKNDEKPQTFYLFEKNELDTILYRSPEFDLKYADGNPEYQYIKQLYLPSKDEITKSDSLYNLIWQPFDLLLDSINTIFISPTGLLNSISFDAIPYNDSTLLSDKYNINILSTTSKIINKKQFYSANISKAVIFGGIDYDVDTTTMKQTAALYNSKEIENQYLAENFEVTDSLDLSAISRGGVWSYLEGAENEAETIKNIFEKSRIKVDYFSGELASEEAFKSLSDNSPSIIHVATHGFYFPDNEKTRDEYSFFDDVQFVFSDNPLLRSGLVFSGGNRIWAGEEIPENVEDGIVSAYDVSQMNLLNNDLIVLSACQTGLGDVIGNEGVYGLQRAFKKAGSGFMIVTLWKVPDLTTQMLMENFYTFFVQGDEIHLAFRKAQNILKEKYSAYGWVAFVLLE